MKIAFASDAAEIGGAEVALRVLLRAGSEAFEPTVLAQSETVAEFLGDAATVEIVPGVGGHLPTANAVRILRKLRPDIVHLNMNSAWSCRGIHESALVGLRCPITATEHSPQFHGKLRGHPILRKRMLSKTLSRHIAVGRRTAREIEEAAGLRRGSLMTIYNGVELIDSPVMQNRRASGLVIGTMARLDKGKRVDLLIDAFEALDRDDCRLRIIGTGPEEGALRERADRSACSERIDFVMPGFGVSARSHLEDLDVFVLPSALEGLPLVLVEAALAGVPSLATDVGSVEEAVLDGVTGRLIRSGCTTSELGRAIAGLLDNSELRSTMGANATSFARRRFSPAKTGRNYAHMWERVLAGPVAKRRRDRLPSVNRAQPRPTTAVLGMGRSGTTWVGQAIAAALSEPLIFEPLNPAHVWQARSLHHHPLPRTNGSLGSEEEAFLDAAMTGLVRNRWTDRFALREHNRGGVLKLVRANLALPWILENHPSLRLAGVVRHPWAVQQSWAARDWGREAWTGLDELDQLLDRCAVYDTYPSIHMAIDALDLERTNHRFLLLWAILNAPLAQTQHTERQFRIWRYEDLTADTTHFEDLLGYCGATVDPAELDRLHGKPSAMSRGRETFGDGMQQPDISDTELRLFDDVLELFGLSQFYELRPQ